MGGGGVINLILLVYERIKRQILSFFLEIFDAVKFCVSIFLMTHKVDNFYEVVIFEVI